jgi:hypothetical protein
VRARRLFRGQNWLISPIRGAIPVEFPADIGRLHEHVLILKNPLSHDVYNLDFLL